MNVGTAAAIKGAVSTMDLHEIGTQVELSNTYHLHVRPGDQVVKKLGGLHKFMNWEQADSHGFRRISGVFSGRAAENQRRRRIFSFPCRRAERFLWGRKRVCRFSRIWRPPLPWLSTNALPVWQTGEYVQHSVDRTTRWLQTLQGRDGND